MKVTRFVALLAAGAAGLACRGADTPPTPAVQQASASENDPPVAVNADSPVEYPPALFEQGIEGKVILRLFVDEKGAVVPDSTRVAESSGYPALDSAALQAAPRLKFAPALKNGEAVSAAFLQPVHFRHPKSGGATP